ncbi:hypothetical protein EGW08_006251 [Elysia chlorotica]|uniref:Cytoplasmic tRNA 2-thiolation protein 1 C-terminal domain-containing protein n=1 Tax=Elysia chlorotica TaxID=188477 RepID=A0A3S0ZSX9_ELYCH|nr:hypothetical protein EGW08_006251 [Elysia chlorotica]
MSSFNMNLCCVHFSAAVCSVCQFVSSNEVCKACVLLEGLNKGRPRLGIGKIHKERRKWEEDLAAEVGRLSVQGAVADDVGGDAGRGGCCGGTGKGGCGKTQRDSRITTERSSIPKTTMRNLLDF